MFGILKWIFLEDIAAKLMSFILAVVLWAYISGSQQERAYVAAEFEVHNVPRDIAELRLYFGENEAAHFNFKLDGSGVSSSRYTVSAVAPKRVFRAQEIGTVKCNISLNPEIFAHSERGEFKYEIDSKSFFTPEEIYVDISPEMRNAKFVYTKFVEREVTLKESMFAEAFSASPGLKIATVSFNPATAVIRAMAGTHDSIRLATQNSKGLRENWTFKVTALNGEKFSLLTAVSVDVTVAPVESPFQKEIHVPVNFSFPKNAAGRFVVQCDTEDALVQVTGSDTDVRAVTASNIYANYPIPANVKAGDEITLSSPDIIVPPELRDRIKADVIRPKELRVRIEASK